MTKRELAAFAVATGATMALTLAVAWPSILSATDARAVQQAKPAPPVLRVGGCELRARPAATDYKAGDTPTVIVEAINTSDQPIKLEATVRMMSGQKSSGLSRIMVLPKEAWKDACPVSLAPGERTSVELATGTKVAAGTNVTLTLTVGDKQVSFAGFSVPAPAPAKKAPAQAN